MESILQEWELDFDNGMGNCLCLPLVNEKITPTSIARALIIYYYNSKCAYKTPKAGHYYLD